MKKQGLGVRGRGTGKRKQVTKKETGSGEPGAEKKVTGKRKQVTGNGKSEIEAGLRR